VSLSKGELLLAAYIACIISQYLEQARQERKNPVWRCVLMAPCRVYIEE